MDTGSLAVFLRQHGVRHTVMEFDRDVSRVSDLPGAGVDPADDVKSLVCLGKGGEPLLAVIPGTGRLDLGKLATALGLASCRLCPAAEIEQRTGYPAGAVPPLGHNTRLRTVVDPRVLERKTVVAGGGTTYSLVTLDPREIVRVGRATVADICERPRRGLKAADAP